MWTNAREKTLNEDTHTLIANAVGLTLALVVFASAR
jgi:hypothetical protein